MQKKKSFHKKSLGQHFLKDSRVIENIVNSAPNLQETNIFEIGPGQGALTIPLLNLSKTLTSIEYDIRLKPFLQNLQNQHGNFNFVINDALKYSFEETTSPYAIISNLPYNIGTELLLRWLKLKNKPTYMLLMFQKEVAQRITAQVGNKNYGRLSIICNILCDCVYLFDVPKDCFDPAPKVDSGVVLLKHKATTIHNETIKKLEFVNSILFNKRRKMIGTILKNYKIPFENLNIDPKKRPEELQLQELIKLTEFF